MAKFENIQPGKKMYQSKCINMRDAGTGKLHKKVKTMYVIAKDDESKLVLASVNKMPPRWFEPNYYILWHNKNPLIDSLDKNDKYKV